MNSSKKEKIVIKYGGNVLIDRKVFNNFISDINVLNKLGLSIIVVHGGGPRIKRELDKKKNRIEIYQWFKGNRQKHYKYC